MDEVKNYKYAVTDCVIPNVSLKLIEDQKLIEKVVTLISQNDYKSFSEALDNQSIRNNHVFNKLEKFYNNTVNTKKFRNEFSRTYGYQFEIETIGIKLKTIAPSVQTTVELDNNSYEIRLNALDFITDNLGWAPLNRLKKIKYTREANDVSVAIYLALTWSTLLRRDNKKLLAVHAAQVLLEYITSKSNRNQYFPWFKGNDYRSLLKQARRALQTEDSTSYKEIFTYLFIKTDIDIQGFERSLFDPDLSVDKNITKKI